MPAATTASLPSIFRFSAPRAISAPEQHLLGHEAEEEHHGDGRQDQRQPQVRLLAIVLVHRHGPQCAAPWLGFTDRGSASSTRVAVGSSRGGVSNVWKGAGEGTSHSRPSAPRPSASFQGRCGAATPLPRMHGSTMKKKKYTWAKPKKKAPTEATALKSANCIG